MRINLKKKIIRSFEFDYIFSKMIDLVKGNTFKNKNTLHIGPTYSL